MFLFFLTLYVFLNSFQIDNSCKYYNGQDISRDIFGAIKEVQRMASTAFSRIFKQDIVQTLLICWKLCSVRMFRLIVMSVKSLRNCSISEIATLSQLFAAIQG